MSFSLRAYSLSVLGEVTMAGHGCRATAWPAPCRAQDSEDAEDASADGKHATALADQGHGHRDLRVM